MSDTIPVLAFQCPGKRHTLCRGYMAAQLLSSEKGRYVVYCSKCGDFYLAEPDSNGMYQLKHVTKDQIKFIPMPFTLKE